VIDLPRPAGRAVSVPLSAVARLETALTVAAAVGTGRWWPFARLTVTAPVHPRHPDLRFDAVLHPPPGLVADGPLARFRRPAYASARAAHP
jgi:hypothetical protein